MSNAVDQGRAYPTHLYEHDMDTGAKKVKIVDETLATSAKQDAIITAIGGSLNDYITQVIDDYTTTSVTYFCKIKSDGTWLTVKIDETGNFPTLTYANVSNNAGLTYATAFTDRVALTYGLLNTLTL